MLRKKPEILERFFVTFLQERVFRLFSVSLIFLVCLLGSGHKVGAKSISLLSLKQEKPPETMISPGLGLMFSLKLYVTSASPILNSRNDTQSVSLTSTQNFPNHLTLLIENTFSK